jgi:hypothetical protein
VTKAKRDFGERARKKSQALLLASAADLEATAAEGEDVDHEYDYDYLAQDRVQVKHVETGWYRPALILKAHIDGTYDVEMALGEVQKKVSHTLLLPAHIKAPIPKKKEPPPPPPKPAKIVPPPPPVEPEPVKKEAPREALEKNSKGRSRRKKGDIRPSMSGAELAAVAGTAEGSQDTAMPAGFESVKLGLSADGRAPRIKSKAALQFMQAQKQRAVAGAKGKQYIIPEAQRLDIVMGVTKSPAATPNGAPAGVITAPAPPTKRRKKKMLLSPPQEQDFSKPHNPLDDLRNRVPRKKDGPAGATKKDGAGGMSRKKSHGANLMLVNGATGEMVMPRRQSEGGGSLKSLDVYCTAKHALGADVDEHAKMARDAAAMAPAALVAKLKEAKLGGKGSGQEATMGLDVVGMTPAQRAKILLQCVARPSVLVGCEVEFGGGGDAAGSGTAGVKMTGVVVGVRMSDESFSIMVGDGALVVMPLERAGLGKTTNSKSGSPVAVHFKVHRKCPIVRPYRPPVQYLSPATKELAAITLQRYAGGRDGDSSGGGKLPEALVGWYVSVPDERGGGGLVIGVQKQEDKSYHELWYDDGDVGLVMLDGATAEDAERDWRPVGFIASMVGTSTSSSTSDVQRRKKPGAASTFAGFPVDSNGFLTGAPDQHQAPAPSQPPAEDTPAPAEPPQRTSQTNWL